jgi:hypothetical protein
MLAPQATTKFLKCLVPGLKCNNDRFGAIAAIIDDLF